MSLGTSSLNLIVQLELHFKELGESRDWDDDIISKEVSLQCFFFFKSLFKVFQFVYIEENLASFMDVSVEMKMQPNNYSMKN